MNLSRFTNILIRLGSKPYFCTLDYNYYDENKDFKVGICSNRDGMIFRNSLQSIIKKLGLTHIEGLN